MAQLHDAFNADETLFLAARLITCSVGKRFGKRIGSNKWIHSSGLDEELVEQAMRFLRHRKRVDQATILFRADSRGKSVSMLHYPHFLSVSHPELCCSVRIDAQTGALAHRSFEASLNKPILHRKELFVPREFALYETFRAATMKEEELGLLQEKSRIGWSRYWTDLLARNGIEIMGHEIRHRTQID